MNLRTLVEKTSDADLLHEMIGFAAQPVMEPQMDCQIGAAYGEKTPERLAERNGCRDLTSIDPSRHDRASDPQAAQTLLFSGFPGAAAHGPEGAHRRHLDPLG
ncbi:hypothetical protein GGD66_002224 [Bradyrhizobium sp. CIR48]|uniref:transposase n=1 Tax=unclassified Bradyrhizobium TaxID=2631580 RepID=UPI00182729CB|nr:transposase [Bradyrhizobium sp. ERR14]MBB4396630.1 hypothetical protein [Bradyrhizobium sp. ERR14]MBB4423680.1 hypothetical protein [Bradyrhizobium sp. CIR48]